MCLVYGLWILDIQQGGGQVLKFDTYDGFGTVGGSFLGQKILVPRAGGTKILMRVGV